jgi:hypothetical protein
VVIRRQSLLKVVFDISVSVKIYLDISQSRDTIFTCT